MNLSNPNNEQSPKVETQSQPREWVTTLPFISLTTAALTLFLFGWIAEEVTREHTMHFDLLIRARVHALSSPTLTRIMFALSFIGREGLIAGTLVSFGIFLKMRWRRAATWLIVTMMGALVLEGVLKLSFHRLRPTPFFGPLPHTYSFPSGHSLSSFCFFAVMAGLLSARLHSRAWRILLWAISALLIASIGFSRIYLGVHYPSDVIAGYAAAVLWVSVLLVADRLHATKKSRGAVSGLEIDTPEISADEVG